jgi:hypothetical protein
MAGKAFIMIPSKVGAHSVPVGCKPVFFCNKLIDFRVIHERVPFGVEAMRRPSAQLPLSA